MRRLLSIQIIANIVLFVAAVLFTLDRMLDCKFNHEIAEGNDKSFVSDFLYTMLDGFLIIIFVTIATNMTFAILLLKRLKRYNAGRGGSSRVKVRKDLVSSYA